MDGTGSTIISEYLNLVYILVYVCFADACIVRSCGTDNTVILTSLVSRQWLKLTRTTGHWKDCTPRSTSRQGNGYLTVHLPVTGTHTHTRTWISACLQLTICVHIRMLTTQRTCICTCTRTLSHTHLTRFHIGYFAGGGRTFLVHSTNIYTCIYMCRMCAHLHVPRGLGACPQVYCCLIESGGFWPLLWYTAI